MKVVKVAIIDSNGKCTSQSLSVINGSITRSMHASQNFSPRLYECDLTR